MNKNLDPAARPPQDHARGRDGRNAGDRASATTPASAATPPTPTRRTVLVIDDNPADRQVVRRYLERDPEKRYTVIEAETGEDGLTRLSAVQPDCILMDYNLPDTDGLELLGSIASQPDGGGTRAVVLMTGSGNETVAARAIQGGALDYLVKRQLSPEALLLALDNAIEKMTLKKEIAEQQAELSRKNRELEQRSAEVHALNLRLQRAMTESHHRIKNNLQTLVYLVNMYTVGSDGTVPVSVLKRFENYITTLATLHDFLTEQVKSDDTLDCVDARALLERLAPLINATAGGRDVYIESESLQLPLRQGSSFLLLVNELALNALKHGRGAVCLSLMRDGGNAVLTVTDDGDGFPSGFNPTDAANTGLELIENLTRFDLAGSITFDNAPGGGACVVVRFPLGR